MQITYFSVSTLVLFLKQNDGYIFSHSSLYNNRENKTWNITEDKALTQNNLLVSRVILGDEVYPLKTFLMKTYPKRDYLKEEESFN